jgi:hypothetical protein
VARISSPLEEERIEPTTWWPRWMSWSMIWAATNELAPVMSVLGIFGGIGNVCVGG